MHKNIYFSHLKNVQSDLIEIVLYDMHHNLLPIFLKFGDLHLLLKQTPTAHSSGNMQMFIEVFKSNLLPNYGANGSFMVCDILYIIQEVSYF